MASPLDIIGVLSTARAAMASASAKLKALAASTQLPALRQEALQAAADIDAAIASTSLTAVTGTIMDEIRDAVMTGRSVVSHQATDLF
jgi:hypothetical protein